MPHTCEALALLPAAAHHFQVPVLVRLLVALQLVAIDAAPRLDEDQPLCSVTVEVTGRP